MKLKIAILVFTCLILASCSAFASPPTSTPAPTLTATQTSTPVPTKTSTPSATPSPLPPTAGLSPLGSLNPIGTPATSWRGIPIMPGAISGEGDDKGYSFTIQATPEEIQEYYDQELRKLGATPFAVGQGDAQGTVLLMYMMDGGIISISIIPQEDFVLVIIV